MKRRDFIGLVGAGSVVPVAIASCTPQSKQNLSASPPRSDGFQAVGTIADLDSKTQLLVENTAAGKVLVIRDPANSSDVIAVNPTCTHAGCTVVWQTDQNQFVCPCHDSKFASDGKVVQGPANQPLATYTTKVEGDSVLVKS